MNQLTIEASVGIKGENRHSDVTAVQTALNQIIEHIQAFEMLAVDGSLGSKPETSKTVVAIKVFQQTLVGINRPDGRIDVNGKSNRYLNELLQSAQSLETTPINVETRQSQPEPQTNQNQNVPWMNTAYQELNVAEIPGRKAHPQILRYFKAAKFWGTDDSGGQNAWCASFVAWIMKENGYEPVTNSFRAKEWANFGKKISQPIYGALGIKSRQGGGHVAFVVGQSSDGKKLFMLGGNQKDKVQILSYDRSVWDCFVVPSDFNTDGIDLPVYTEAVSGAGRED